MTIGSKLPTYTSQIENIPSPDTNKPIHLARLPSQVSFNLPELNEGIPEKIENGILHSDHKEHGINKGDGNILNDYNTGLVNRNQEMQNIAQYADHKGNKDGVVTEREVKAVFASLRDEVRQSESNIEILKDEDGYSKGGVKNETLMAMEIYWDDKEDQGSPDYSISLQELNGAEKAFDEQNFFAEDKKRSILTYDQKQELLSDPYE